MAYKKNNYIDDLVDMFGYDYVIGYCLCSEQNLKNLAESEEDEEKRSNLFRKSKRYSAEAQRLIKDRFNYGL